MPSVIVREVFDKVLGLRRPEATASSTAPCLSSPECKQVENANDKNLLVVFEFSLYQDLTRMG